MLTFESLKKNVSAVKYTWIMLAIGTESTQYARHIGDENR